MKKLLISLVAALGFMQASYAKQDGIVILSDNDKPINIQHEPEKWKQLVEYEKKEFWIYHGQIDVYNPDEKTNIRRVFAMIRFTDGEKKVPGVGIGVRKVYSEAAVNCIDAAVIPVRDFYTDDMGAIIRVHTHPRGSFKTITQGKTPGTLANIAYELACNGQIPEIRQ